MLFWCFMEHLAPMHWYRMIASGLFRVITCHALTMQIFISPTNQMRKYNSYKCWP